MGSTGPYALRRASLLLFPVRIPSLRDRRPARQWRRKQPAVPPRRYFFSSCHLYSSDAAGSPSVLQFRHFFADNQTEFRQGNVIVLDRLVIFIGCPCIVT